MPPAPLCTGSSVPHARTPKSLPRSGRRRAALAAAVAATALASIGTSPAAAAGVTIDNCGVPVHVDKPPTRAVSLNQGATEMMLALGLQKSMIGTAYLDDAVLPIWKSAYNSVPVLAKEYPSAENFLAAKPDFAFASYGSAFSAKEGVGTRESLAKLGIATYLMPAGCAGAKATEPASFTHLWAQLRQLGSLFGIDAKAKQVVAQQKAALKAAKANAAPAKGKRVLWWDSGTKAPFVGACCGGPALAMRQVGATNVFSDAKGNWIDSSWETVLDRRPDVIVLVDASWDTAKDKIKFLTHSKALKDLPAVKNRRFVVIPFSSSTPGVRIVDGVKRLSAGLRKYRSVK